MSFDSLRSFILKFILQVSLKQNDFWSYASPSSTNLIRCRDNMRTADSVVALALASVRQFVLKSRPLYCSTALDNKSQSPALLCQIGNSQSSQAQGRIPLPLNFTELQHLNPQINVQIYRQPPRITSWQIIIEIQLQILPKWYLMTLPPFG